MIQASLTQEACNVWLQSQNPGNSWFGELSLSTLFKRWVELTVAPTPVMEVDCGSRLMVASGR